MLTQEQLEKVLLDSSDEIKAAILAEVKRQLPDTVSYVVMDMVREEVKAFGKEHLAAEIRVALIEDKPQIVAAAVKASREIGESVAAALVKRVQERLSETYSARSILKALVE